MDAKDTEGRTRGRDKDLATFSGEGIEKFFKKSENGFNDYDVKTDLSGYITELKKVQVQPRRVQKM